MPGGSMSASCNSTGTTRWRKTTWLGCWRNTGAIIDQALNLAQQAEEKLSDNPQVDRHDRLGLLQKRHLQDGPRVLEAMCRERPEERHVSVPVGNGGMEARKSGRGSPGSAQCGYSGSEISASSFGTGGSRSAITRPVETPFCRWRRHSGLCTGIVFARAAKVVPHDSHRNPVRIGPQHFTGNVEPLSPRRPTRHRPMDGQFRRAHLWGTSDRTMPEADPCY